MTAFELRPHPDAASLAAAAARDWLEVLGQRQVPGAPWSVALSGGRIARGLFRAAAASIRTEPGLLEAVHFFWADERCVLPDHPESNFGAANALLLGPAGVPPEQVHRVRGELPPEEAARLASVELATMVCVGSAGVPMLDLVWLGMGEDGHVASLFPDDAAAESGAWYHAVTAPKPPPRRVTLSYEVLAAARDVWVLASGPGKQAALRESLRAGGRTPLARVLRLRPHTRIYTDGSAAC